MNPQFLKHSSPDPSLPPWTDPGRKTRNPTTQPRHRQPAWRPGQRYWVQWPSPKSQQCVRYLRRRQFDVLVLSCWRRAACNPGYESTFYDLYHEAALYHSYFLFCPAALCFPSRVFRSVPHQPSQVSTPTQDERGIFEISSKRWIELELSFLPPMRSGKLSWSICRTKYILPDVCSTRGPVPVTVILKFGFWGILLLRQATRATINFMTNETVE